ncbi:hotdog family protein [Undibacterium sp. LX40W]|uniref:Hotdog family protein n=1 Tax=Undibacterium nitidum TaxID=2762298 RepID=A0A923HNF7_9BURK|nr:MULTISPECIES: hotdog family protein [Undibacterium]MBC3880913.1 hotdog family protein [Undibacterium nitidum]MBC3890354.1 hotdog family protein [Undibacterium sp. LX40W]
MNQLTSETVAYPAIRTLVPHQDPMVLLDEVIAADADSLCAKVRIHAESLFFDGEGVGAWVGIEYMAQAIAAHAGYLAHTKGEPIKVGFLLGTRRFETKTPRFTLGSNLHIQVHCSLQSDNGLGAFECNIVDCEAPNENLASATITVFQPHDAKDFLQGKSM